MDPGGTFSMGAAPDGAPRPSRWRRGRGRTFRRVSIGLGIVVLSGWMVWARCGVAGCPAVDRLRSYQPEGAPVLLDRNGAAFARLAPVERRTVALGALPEHVPAAFLAVEDRRFYRHSGIDWVRVAGAAMANLRAGRTVQGSSTITMQLARNVFPDRIPAAQRTWRRKLLEARVARSIEKRFSKSEILELYLNHIYFGNGAWGIEAAARHYFGRAAAELSLEQVALLAALPKAPARYDPRRHPQRARGRRDLVVTLMQRQGVVTRATAERAKARPVRVAAPTDPRRLATPNAPYFVQRVRDELEDRLGRDLWTQRLVVHTTIDARVQRALEESLEAQLRRVEAGAFGRYTGPRRDAVRGDGAVDYLQGAAVALEGETGDVRGLVGGRDWVHSRFNRAVDARRQVGSAFKPFVFAAALARGWNTGDWLDDSPYRRAARGSETWEPSNFDGRFFGPVTLREAIVLSRNVPTVRLAETVGVNPIRRTAREAGLSGDMPESPVIALGVTESSPLELAMAYTIFANGGTRRSPRFVTRVEDAEGRVRWEARDGRTRRVLDERVAARMTGLLRDAVDNGTGRAVRSAGYRGPAAGKTGTTNDGTDAWFVGYTPTLVTAVWVGFDRPRPIAPRASGGTVAAEIWGRAMRRIETGGAGWPSRIAHGDGASAEPRPGREAEAGRSPRGDWLESWIDELERERRRIQRGWLRALTERLEDAVNDLPIERDARRELRSLLRDLGRELERAEREWRREGDARVQEWLEDALDDLDDERIPGALREQLHRELERSRR